MSNGFYQDLYLVKNNEIRCVTHHFRTKPSTESLTWMFNSLIHSDDPTEFYIVLNSKNNYYGDRSESAFQPLFNVVNNVEDIELNQQNIYKRKK